MPISRRQVIAASAAGLAAAGLSTAAPTDTPKRRTKLGVSTYSYWHFKPEKVPIESCILDAAKIGFDAVEVLHRQMENDTPAPC